MVRYLQPDNHALGYHAQGELLSLTPGDFFKCSHCKRFQRFEGRLYVMGQLAETLSLCCELCRQEGVACRLWLPEIRKIG